MPRFQTSRSSRQMGPVGQIIFGGIWTLFSSIFVCLGLFTTWKGVSQSTWDKVPCVIERFEIRADPKKDPAFETDLIFRYEWDGKAYTSSKLRPAVKGDNEFEKLSEIRERLLAENQRDTPNGLRTECRVDPKHPESASLLPPSGTGWFGLIFVAFGGGFMLLGISIIRAGIRSGKHRALSDAASSTSQMPFSPIIFFAIFALAGLGVTCGFVIPSAIRYFSAKSWVETPATVVWSRVKSHSGSKGGSTYSVDLFYRYQFQGHDYRSNRYTLMSGSSSGRDSKQEIVKSYPPKSPLTCYVNPQKPWQAIVKRDLGASALFALFPLPFLAIGIGGIVWTLRKKRAAQPLSSSPRSPTAEPLAADLPERILSTGKSRWINFGAALFICAFWNGIVSVFVGIAWNAWKKGNPETFLMIFLIPFVLVGIFLLLQVPYRLLIVFLARYELRLAPGTLKPGGTATLTWRRFGGYGQPKSIALRLSGSESATSQSGKNSSTATSLFHDEVLAELSLNSISANRPIAIKLPDSAVPTFKGSSNKIVWKLRMDLTLPGFPKITDDFEIDVRPLRRDELS